ncbi:hypothetical protein ACWEK5_00225 [Rhodococcus koreensis]
MLRTRRNVQGARLFRELTNGETEILILRMANQLVDRPIPGKMLVTRIMNMFTPRIIHRDRYVIDAIETLPETPRRGPRA